MGAATNLCKARGCVFAGVREQGRCTKGSPSNLGDLAVTVLRRMPQRVEMWDTNKSWPYAMTLSEAESREAMNEMRGLEDGIPSEGNEARERSCEKS
jgi:hypothetical protein